MTAGGEAPIGWYPGHMAAAMRRLGLDLRAVDIVIEIADARLPHAGRNPALLRLAAHKARLLVLSRAHLADGDATARWLAYYREREAPVIAIDARDRGGVARLRAEVKALGRRRTQRAIVLGIPNAGKSTVINALAGRTVARTANRAGVTRARQWFRTGSLEVMDTAGILAPKIESVETQWKLALVGAVPRARFDPEDVVERFYRWCGKNDMAGRVPDMETFAQSRGIIRHGTMPAVHNAAWAYLAAWNAGSFGRMTLEAPPAT